MGAAPNLNQQSPAFHAAESVGFNPAGNNKRVVAFVIDSIIVTIAMKFLMTMMAKSLHVNPLAAQGLAWVICVSMYWIGLTLNFGATPGKKIMGIRIVTDQHAPDVGVGQIILRETIGRILSILPCFLGYAWVSWDKERRTFHDMIAKTRVVEYR